MAIVAVAGGDPLKMTANLKAPLLVNPDRRIGRQVILGSQTYSIREPLPPVER